MVNFKSKLKKSLEDRPKPDWEARPEVLMLPQIPKPLHGMAPRVILGGKWWNETRYAAYETTDNHCIACKVYKTRARGPKWMEAHEIYRTDYKVGRLYYIEAVPLCHFCHNYIHQGRLQSLLDKHKISLQRFVAIIQHGDRVLAKAGLVKPPEYTGPFVEWSKWRLVLNGKMYGSKFKSFEHWQYYYFSKES